MDVLLGSRDLTEIEKVYEWVCDVKPYLWRLNQSPAQDVERAAVLGSDSDRFIISCDYISNGRPARGVVASSRAEK